MPHPRTLLVGLLLFIFTLAIPLALVVLTPAWYLQNCQWHGRCASLGESTALLHIENLRDYFLHRDSLGGSWSDKERNHLVEVRDLYDVFAMLSVAALLAVVAGMLVKPTWIRSASLANFVYILSLLLFLPGFTIFWRDMLHPLVFSNIDWMTNPNDMTWYITPGEFFRNSLIAVIAMAVMINLAIYAVSNWCAHRYGDDAA